MFYDTFKQICDERGITPNKACLEMGLSRSLAAKWKNTGANPSFDVLTKMAEYFGVTTDFLLGKSEQKEKPSEESKGASAEDIQFALWGEHDEITEELYQDVQDYARYLMEKKRQQRK